MRLSLTCVFVRAVPSLSRRWFTIRVPLCSTLCRPPSPPERLLCLSPPFPFASFPFPRPIWRCIAVMHAVATHVRIDAASTPPPSSLLLLPSPTQPPPSLPFALCAWACRTPHFRSSPSSLVFWASPGLWKGGAANEACRGARVGSLFFSLLSFMCVAACVVLFALLPPPPPIPWQPMLVYHAPRPKPQSTRAEMHVQNQSTRPPHSPLPERDTSRRCSAE